MKEVTKGKGLDGIYSDMVYVLLFLNRYKEVTFTQLLMLIALYGSDKRIDLKYLASCYGYSQQWMIKLKDRLIDSGYMIDGYNMVISDKGIELCKEFKKGLRG